MKGLYKRRNIWWYRDWQTNGERRFRSTGETDEKLAEAIAQGWQEEALAERKVFRAQYSIDNMIERYLDGLRKTAQRRRADGRDSNYIRSAQHNLERWSREIGVVSIGDVTEARLQAWIDHKEQVDKIRPTTMEEYLGQVRRFLNFASTIHKSFRNPIKEVRWLKPLKDGEARTEWVKADDMDKLINECADLELKYILYAGFHAGMRFEEVDKSSSLWFDLGARLIRIQRDPRSGWVPKDLEARAVPITDEFLEFLETEYAFRMNGAYMVAPKKLEQGEWRYRFDFGNRFKAYMRKKGFGHICFHDLRRSFGCQLASAGVPIAHIARWLGNDEATALKHYGKYSPEFHAQINDRRPAGATRRSDRKVVPMPAQEQGS